MSRVWYASSCIWYAMSRKKEAITGDFDVIKNESVWLSFYVVLKSYFILMRVNLIAAT
jgi:hypothetical protein